MSEPFTLKVPAEGRYRVIGPEVAGRYVELLGGSDADRQALMALLTDALADIAEATDGSCDLTFAPTEAGVEVTVRCGARTAVVRHVLHHARPGSVR
jgi:hypothetical protein